ncbi:MAG TPA: aspartate aminotransferase family protein [Bryobacterales bacterium]|nr:aspartate aminotransferase family protein [Bryobacterales bacterium]
MEQQRDRSSSGVAVAAARATAYRTESAASRRLYERASRVMPGGNTRHSIAVSPYPVYVQSGRGCRVVDVEGEERIDFLNNFTSLILGHADPQVSRAVRQRLDHGTAFTMPTEPEVEMAELLVSRVPYIERIRFCNSGSEAVLLALKAARAFTGRSKIAKFEGAYHGIYDYVQVSEGPSPDDWGEAEAPASVLDPSSSPSVAQDVVVLPWNNPEACRRLIRQHRNELAVVVADPLPARIGMIAPRPGFLELLREETERHHILYLSEEVMSFRLSYHGALHGSGIRPDLTTIAKIIGGGFPVGAVGGSAEIMSVFDHTGKWKVHHGGTFNANPVTMTAGLETMRQMTPEAYGRLNHMGDSVRERLTRMLVDQRIAARVCGKGSLFTVHLTGREPVDFRSLPGDSRTKAVYGELFHEMLAQGIVTTPRGIFGCLSTPMTDAELEAFVEALARSLTTLGYKA